MIIDDLKNIHFTIYLLYLNIYPYDNVLKLACIGTCDGMM